MRRSALQRLSGQRLPGQRLPGQRLPGKPTSGLPALTSLVLLASLAFLAALPGTTPAFSAVDHQVILQDRLNDVRELLVRRQAHRSMLIGQIERDSRKLDRLQTERETALEALADQEDLARAHERQLDELMPRLLPRLGVLDRLRKKGAHTITNLANMERHTDLEARKRSHLKASQTASIEQMRLASTAVRLLRRAPNTLKSRHRDVDFQIPLLAASVNRLDIQQSQLQRRRDSAIRDLADLTVDIERLTTEEHRIARNMLARSLEATDGADVDRNSRQNSRKTVLLNRRGLGKSTIGSADVRGIALRRTQPTPVARPLDGIGAGIGQTALASVEPADPAISAKSESSALLAGLADRQKPWAADVASLDTKTGADGLVASADAGRIDRGEVLVPTIETIGFTAGGGDRSEIEIAARPRQRVAAPNEGIVAFAGDFRSYGLLLIIEHGNGYHTLLWGFSSLDIGFGDAVRAGQIVGTLRDGPSPKLHVELRRNGQPVSPEVWLAASNSGVKG